MKIGILGSGDVGKTLGKGLVKLGHDVKLGTRDTGKLGDWKKEVGNKGSVGSLEETAKFGEIIFLCVKGDSYDNVLAKAKLENFENKVVIDVTNPLDESSPPKMFVSSPNSLGKIIQALIPKAKVVKAFNTVSARIMISPKLEEGNPVLFICGNDDSAKNTVKKLATQLGWKSVEDLGDINQAYLLEAFAMLWITYGFKNNYWTHAFSLLKK